MNRNEPLGLQHQPARTSTSSLSSTIPSPFLSRRSSSYSRRPPEKKRTADGKIVLEPQPDDSLNDPLNWKAWRRDMALLAVGLYSMVGGGMTPILAAGFNDVAETYDVTVPEVALTTGLYMMGLGLGSVVASPTAILYGKRPVYLTAALLFALSSVWCALATNFPSLIAARIIQGLAVSPVECLPSATVAEIYFLHERAYRLGIYTLLLLGGKNLVPLISAVIIKAKGWRWVFWVVAIFVAFCLILLVFFVPETFWDRTPHPAKHSSKKKHARAQQQPTTPLRSPTTPRRNVHIGFADDVKDNREKPSASESGTNEDYFSIPRPDAAADARTPGSMSIRIDPPPGTPSRPESTSTQDVEKADLKDPAPAPNLYTEHYRQQPPKSYVDTLKPFHGRLCNDSWVKAAIRPFILFAYPAVLWSTLVYSLSVGWLIVLSESMAVVFMRDDTYNFNALQTGLVYISPFIGSVLGTAVAGKLSDIIVRFMSRRNDGVYEPEFRLVMAIPIALSTTAGLIGFGWSAEDHNGWAVPTVFFGLIGFGCSLGSTTAITFCVDSYRQYAGEALVTLNFSKSECSPLFQFAICSYSQTNRLTSPRHLPRSRLLPLLHPLARGGRLQAGFPRHRHDPARLPRLLRAHVHLRQARPHVHGQAESHGEVLVYDL